MFTILVFGLIGGLLGPIAAMFFTWMIRFLVFREELAPAQWGILFLGGLVYLGLFMYSLALGFDASFTTLWLAMAVTGLLTLYALARAHIRLEA